MSLMSEGIFPEQQASPTLNGDFEIFLKQYLEDIGCQIELHCFLSFVNSTSTWSSEPNIDEMSLSLNLWNEIPPTSP
jgi:hypothetical protein